MPKKYKHIPCNRIVYTFNNAFLSSSDLSDKPLLKKMSDTAIYLTVISGINGPKNRKQLILYIAKIYVCISDYFLINNLLV